MKKFSKNLDGIFIRRTDQPAVRPVVGSPAKFSPKPLASAPPQLARPDGNLGDIDHAQPKTIGLDLTLDDTKKKSKKKVRLIKRIKAWRPSKKFFIKLAIFILVVGLVIAGYFAYKVFVASGQVFKGGGQSVIGKTGIDKTKLQHEGDGRVNVLLVATSEDDAGHPGATLTDSIMILSIDPIGKSTTLVSIPRDLWVEMPGCTMYSQKKINAAYQCGEAIKFKEAGFPDGGMGYLQKIIKTVSGVNINYYAKINYAAFKQAVDAVEGIDITIASPDPRGILDRNFDWLCYYSCYKVKWPNGVAHLNGESALFLARSRNSSGGYGLPRSDFDRTEYQRKMMVALKEKAINLGTLSNPIKLNGLIDSIGNNLVTNFSREDIVKLYTLAKDISSDKISSIGLADEGSAVLTTGVVPGESIVLPTVGMFKYSDVQLAIRKNMIDPYVKSESPTIAIYNGGGKAGAAAEQKAILESFGYNVVIAESAPTQDYAKTEFYDLAKGKKEITLQYLQNRYSVTAKSTLPAGIVVEYGAAEVDANGQPKPKKTADYVIILGSN